MNQASSIEFDVLKLGWLSIPEKQEFHMAKLAFHSANCRNWPEHLKIKQYVHTRNLRSSKDFKLCSNYTLNTFEHSASNVNSLALSDYQGHLKIFTLDLNHILRQRPHTDILRQRPQTDGLIKCSIVLCHLSACIVCLLIPYSFLICL